MRLHPRRFPLSVVLVASLALAACGAGDTSSADEMTVDVPETREQVEEAEPPASDDVDVERRLERRVFDLVNEERRARGLEPLEWDQQLAQLAREWSRGMADDGSLEHQDPHQMLERTDGLTGVGENIFRSTGPVPVSTVHVRWMRSDGHRANVLRPEFDRLGVGFVCTEDGQVFATQRFGRSGPPSAGGVDGDIPPQEPILAEEGAGPSCPAA